MLNTSFHEFDAYLIITSILSGIAGIVTLIMIFVQSSTVIDPTSREGGIYLCVFFFTTFALFAREVVVHSRLTWVDIWPKNLWSYPITGWFLLFWKLIVIQDLENDFQKAFRECEIIHNSILNKEDPIENLKSQKLYPPIAPRLFESFYPQRAFRIHFPDRNLRSNSDLEILQYFAILSSLSLQSQHTARLIRELTKSDPGDISEDFWGQSLKDVTSPESIQRFIDQINYLEENKYKVCGIR